MLQTKIGGTCVEDTMNYPGPEDNGRESFERVWQRVSPGDQETCPIGLGPLRIRGRETPPPQCPCTLIAAQTPGTPAEMDGSGSSSPAGSGAPVEQQNGGDFPSGDMVPCLGAASAEYGEQLREFIEDELSDWRYYQALARRAGSPGGRTLAGIAADEYRHAKRLAAAYFLISGVRYWPEKGTVAPAGSYLGALRHRFAAEQRGGADYLTAAAGCTDSCLRDLFLENAREEAAHAQQIRGLVEQL